MNPNKNRKRGKRNEALLAKRLGGKRQGILGKDDVVVGPYSIEAKSRKRYSVTQHMEQAERNAQPDQVPLVILHTHGQRRSNDLVMMRLKTFEEWYGSIKCQAGKN
jgi:hypothetical protein